MRRLTIALAAAAAFVPAVLGLVGNSSFAETVPTPVPPSAQVVRADDHGGARPTGTRTAEPGDDHGGARPTGTRTAEPGDDHGGRGSDDTKPDDSGSHSSGGHGSDDGRGGDR